MFDSAFFLQIKHNLTKRNFEMYFRPGKTNTFLVFHVENGKTWSMLWFYGCLNVEIHVILAQKFRHEGGILFFQPI